MIIILNIKRKIRNIYDSNRQQFKQLSDEDKQEIMNMRANRDCWKFLNTGICQFGDKCHYKHDESKRLVRRIGKSKL